MTGSLLGDGDPNGLSHIGRQARNRAIIGVSDGNVDKCEVYIDGRIGPA